MVLGDVTWKTDFLKIFLQKIEREKNQKYHKGSVKTTEIKILFQYMFLKW